MPSSIPDPRAHGGLPAATVSPDIRPLTETAVACGPMDLKEYERAKFALADLLRALAALVKGRPQEDEERLRGLYARLAEDRFNLVVAGRFSRGKTSLMNAILGTDRLPVGIVPLTSVITTVTYGSKEQLLIHYQDHALAAEAPLDALPTYVTQQHNPGNARRVKTVEVKLPVEILRRGMHFIDTPGLGSSIPQNTRTTEAFLPEADALLLVTSYESPLSEEEQRILQAAAISARRVYVVLNKQDIVSQADRAEVLAFTRAQLAAWFDRTAPQIFSVSAREALAARRAHDAAQLAASGLPALEAELVRFLVTEKSREFLLRLCDRIAEWLREFPADTDTLQLIERTRALSCRIGREPVGAFGHDTATGEAAAVSGIAPTFQVCEICARVSDATFEFLRRYQYDLSVNQDVQRHHAERGGLCPLHTWQYAALAAPRDICTGYAALLERLSGWFRDAATTTLPTNALAAQIRKLIPADESCELCRVCAQAQAGAVAAAAGRLQHDPDSSLASLSAICLPHLRDLVAAVRDAAVARKLLAREAYRLERLSEDMRRYAIKHDAVRRFLASEEEKRSCQRALQTLAGLRNLKLAQPGD
jgi:small GTP-binding protein